MNKVCIYIVSLSTVVFFALPLCTCASNCLYQQAHFFFCDVGSKACEEYMDFATEYFMNELKPIPLKNYLKKDERIYTAKDYPFGILLKKAHDKLSVYYPEDQDCDKGLMIYSGYKGDNYNLTIYANKISDPGELRRFFWLVGGSPKEIYPDACPTLEPYCLDELNEPLNKQEMYVFGIIGGGTRGEREILQEFYDRLQDSDILFRGQVIRTKLICIPITKEEKLSAQDKLPLRLSKKDEAKRLKDEREKRKKEKE